MIANSMTAFNQLLVEAWRCIHVFSETEKGGSDVFVFQYVEHPGRNFRRWPIIEGEEYAFFALIQPPDRAGIKQAQE